MTSMTDLQPDTRSAIHTRRSLRRAALSDITAVAPGIVPFGITLGITAITTKTGAVAGVLGAVLIYGGSAQLAAITVLHLGSGLLAAVVSGAVVNARVLLYGAALEPWFRGQPLWFRWLAPQFILDQTYLSAIARGRMRPEEFRRYWGWLGFLLLFLWTGSVVLGLLVEPLLPPMPHLVLVGTALFVAMLVPRLAARGAIVAAGVSAGVALVVAHVVPEVGILSGTAAGVLAAVAAETKRRS